jgi:FtsP/CotA-like multicopper oxidase with cupredoxin domain
MSEAPQPPPSGQQPSGSGGSRSLWTTLAVALGVVVLAGILFIILRPDDSEPAADTIATEPTTTAETTTEVTTEETTTEETTTEETTTTEPANQPVRVTARYQNGEVVGGLVEAEAEQGQQVVLTVRADVTDEVHLHGYDLFADVAPGQPARITFRADNAGVFEAELEDLGIPVVELTVNP